MIQQCFLIKLLRRRGKMPIAIASLSTKIQTEIIVERGAPDDSSLLKKMADAIAKAVVDEFKTNGTVLPGSFTNSGGAVTGKGQVE